MLKQTKKQQFSLMEMKNNKQLCKMESSKDFYFRRSCEK